MSLRDNQQEFLKWFDAKADKKDRWYGVITDRYGNQSGDNTIWADYSIRMVWYMPIGATVPGQIRCALVTSPYIGLGVECGFLEGSVEPEIISDAKFLRNIPVGNQDWLVTNPDDLGTDGRSMIWTDSRTIQPLATYPGEIGGLTVSIAQGDYPYLGARKTFDGVINLDLSASIPGTTGQWRYVGIYLDSSNEIQTIDGVSTDDNLDPAEPAWAVGVFRLAVVRLAYGQTEISFADDIQDRRMFVSETGALCNYTATSDPTENDDVGDGYSIDSTWVNTSTDTIWFCTDNTSGAAIWVEAQACAAGVYDMPSVVNNGDNTYTVGSGIYRLFTNADGTGVIRQYVLAGDTFTPIENANNYLVVDYNNGSPQLQNLTSVSTVDGLTIILVAFIYRIGTQIDIMTLGEQATAMPNRLNNRLMAINSYTRESGLTLSESATRLILISAGVYWYGDSRVSLPAFTTGAIGNVLREWVYNGSIWNPTTVTQYNNSEYQGATGKIAATGNKYLILWVYRKVSTTDPLGIVAGYILGLDEYTSLANAQNAAFPANIPPIFQIFGMLVGRIIIQNGASSATEIAQAYATVFSPAVTGGIAAEIHAATPKTTPIDADELALVDSADSYLLKKLTWANLKATLAAILDFIKVSKVVASDGSPDALTTDAAGAVTIPVSLTLAAGATVSDISNDTTLGDDSATAVTTEHAVKTFVETLDKAKVSKLWESDGGAVAWATDAVGDLLAANTKVAQATWFDYTLYDTANASGIASHFKDNSATYPTGWTEADAASSTNTNSQYSFWYLQGSSTETSWKYRRQTSITLESLAANDWASFQFGPVLFRDYVYTADINYYFGMYGDNAGAIDENKFSRVHLYYNQASAIWQIRGEAKDGTTETDGSWITLDQNPLALPFYIRFLVRYDANNATRQYVGTTPIAKSHKLLQSVNKATTWGQLWLQIHQSRGSGVEDYMYIGSADYLANTP